MTKPRTHTLDIYRAELHMATDRRAWAALRRRFPYLDKAPAAAGLSQFATFHPNDGGHTVPILVLWVDVKAHRGAGELVETCAHEASHAASQLFEHVGHDVKGTDEPHAYLVGWLTRWLWEGCEASER
jgi:hypothetical protein